MAHRTGTSPAALKVTGVELPGLSDPRLNLFSAWVESTLWNTLSSFTNTTVSPTLIESSLSEKTLPFWVMVFSVAANATAVPARNAAASTRLKPFISILLCKSGLLAGDDRHRRGIDVAGQRLHEFDDIGQFLLGQVQRPDQVRPALALDAGVVVVLHHLFERGHGTVVHVRPAARDLAQARSL